MKLAVFDIDGTLTVGDGLGTRCFFRAFEDMFGAGLVDRRLETYAESTDCGIAMEAALRALGRPPSPRELDAFKDLYLGRLEQEILRVGGAYRPVAGADSFLPLLHARGDWHVAIATGNWRRAASLKLDCARIPEPRVAACSEDGTSRSQVLAAAIASATTAAGGRKYDHVVYVGDQPWDLSAARQLGVGFLGIGSGPRALRLQQQGTHVVEDYFDTSRLLHLLEETAEAGNNR
ncbi:MAG: HAD family hydrolase [Candidatus Binatia bacterium]